MKCNKFPAFNKILNKHFGGYSYPNANVDGAYSSLDGKTLEEVTGLSFKQWQDNWKMKYGN